MPEYSLCHKDMEKNSGDASACYLSLSDYYSNGSILRIVIYYAFHAMGYTTEHLIRQKIFNMIQQHKVEVEDRWQTPLCGYSGYGSSVFHKCPYREAVSEAHHPQILRVTGLFQSYEQDATLPRHIKNFLALILEQFRSNVAETGRDGTFETPPEWSRGDRIARLWGQPSSSLKIICTILCFGTVIRLPQFPISPWMVQ